MSGEVLRLLGTAAFTVVLETPVMFLCLIRELKAKKLSALDIAASSLLINLITNLTLNTVLTLSVRFLGLEHKGFVYMAAVLEAAVFISESFMYGFAFGDAVSRKKLWLVVSAANVISLTVGLLV